MLRVAPEFVVPSLERRFPLSRHTLSRAVLGVVAGAVVAGLASTATMLVQDRIAALKQTALVVTSARLAVNAATALAVDREETVLALESRTGPTQSLAQTRRAADSALDALATVAEPPVRDELARVRAQLERARARADGAISARRRTDPSMWLDDSSAMIETVAGVRRTQFAMPGLDARAAAAAALQEAAFTANEYVARERARIGAALAAGVRLTPRDLRRLDGDRALAGDGIVRLRVLGSAPDLDLARDYRLVRERVVEDERYGGLPHVRAAAFVAVGRAAVHSIAREAAGSLRVLDGDLATELQGKRELRTAIIAAAFAFVAIALVLIVPRRTELRASAVRPLRAFVVIEGGRTRR